MVVELPRLRRAMIAVTSVQQSVRSKLSDVRPCRSLQAELLSLECRRSHRCRNAEAAQRVLVPETTIASKSSARPRFRPQPREASLDDRARGRFPVTASLIMQRNERWLTCSRSPGERICFGSCARRLDAPILGNDAVVDGMSDRHTYVRPPLLAGGRLTVRADLRPRIGSTRARLGFEALSPRAGAAAMIGEDLPCAGARS
jgi:hypothetical protein